MRSRYKFLILPVTTVLLSALLVITARRQPQQPHGLHELRSHQASSVHKISGKRMPTMELGRLWSSCELRADQVSIEKASTTEMDMMGWDGVTALSWSPDGKNLIVGTAKSKALFSHALYHDALEVWSVAERQFLFKMETHSVSGNGVHAYGEEPHGEADQVYSPVWSSSGKAIAAGAPGSVSLWNVKAQLPPSGVRDELWTTTFVSKVACVACQYFSHDERTLTVLYTTRTQSRGKNFISRCALAQYDATTGSKKSERVLEVRQVKPPNPGAEFSSGLIQPATADGGTTIAFITERGIVKPPTLFIRSPASSHSIALPFSPSSSTQLSLSADGSTLALKTDTDTLSLRDTRTGKQFRRIKARSMGSYALAPDGKQVALVDAKHGLALWNARTGIYTKTLMRDVALDLSQPDYKKVITQLQFSPDASTLAVARQDGTVTLWRVR